jgi:hypothetical protein
MTPIEELRSGRPRHVTQDAAGAEVAEPSAKRAKIDLEGEDTAEASPEFTAVRAVIVQTLGLPAILSRFDSRVVDELVRAYFSGMMDKSVTLVKLAQLTPNLPTESKLQNYLRDLSDTGEPNMILGDMSRGIVLGWAKRPGGERTRAYFLTPDGSTERRLQPRYLPKEGENNPFRMWEIYRFPRELVDKCSGCSNAPEEGQSLYPPVEVMPNRQGCIAAGPEVPSGVQFCRDCFHKGNDIIPDDYTLLRRRLLD